MKRKYYKVILLIIVLIFIGYIFFQSKSLNQFINNTSSESQTVNNCSKQQIENYSNNYITSLVGQDWFSKYYYLLFSSVIKSGDYVVYYDFDYGYLNHSVYTSVISEKLSLLFNSSADCRDVYFVDGSIVKPFTISISTEKAIDIFHSNGYNNTTTISLELVPPSNYNDLIEYKPAYVASINSSFRGYVDAENGNFSIVPIRFPPGPLPG